ncbi:MAG: SPOR domain-containing protein [Paracoccaceae bacterium]
MTYLRPRSTHLLALVACASLAACSAGTPLSPTEDVAAPAIFDAEDTGQWDGRPSLGGVWVTHPAAKSPERVFIKNMSNGRQTVGALYTGESSDNPPVRVSSEAAQALGMRAQAAAVLRITALRRPGDIGKTSPTAAPATAPVPRDRPADLSGPQTSTLGNSSVSVLAPRRSVRPQAAPLPARPALQIGIFSTRTNARRAQARLQDAGVPAIIRSVTLQGGTYYSLGTGAIRTERARDRLLARAHAAGFGDAYATPP